MILKELKEMFEKLPDNTVLQHGIGKPTSWRGAYSEVCFPIEERILAAQCKKYIQEAYDETFCGYKGGDYEYDDFTPVNFEDSGSSCSDGVYREEVISDIIGINADYDRDKFLVKLMIENGE